jgi:hypothetical protein
MREDGQVDDGHFRNPEGDSFAGQFNEKDAKIPDFWKSYTEIAQKHGTLTTVCTAPSHWPTITLSGWEMSHICAER